jgi:hypothetical protein
MVEYFPEKLTTVCPEDFIENKRIAIKVKTSIKGP